LAFLDVAKPAQQSEAVCVETNSAF
jgi:hypothetical protein